MNFKNVPDSRMSEKDWRTLVDAMHNAIAHEVFLDNLLAGDVDIHEYIVGEEDTSRNAIIIRCFNPNMELDEDGYERWIIDNEHWGECEFYELVSEIVDGIMVPLYEEKYSIKEAAYIAASYLYFVCRGEEPANMTAFECFDYSDSGMLNWYRKAWKDGYNKKC